MSGFGEFNSLMLKLGESCLYVKKLDDINAEVLHSLIERSVDIMRRKYKAD